MCEPVTIAASAAAAASLAGTGMAVYGQHRQGQSQAAMAEANAQLAKQQAADAKQQGAYAAASIMAEGRQHANAARTALAASGVETTSGTAGNIPGTSMVNAAVDAARAKSNAARQAWGFRAEAQDRLAQGRLANQAGYLGAIGTGLSGLGSAAGTGAGVYSALK